MTKYQEYFNRMLAENKEAFDKFKNLHGEYGMDEEKYQDKFNKEGEKIMKIVNEWENKLCSQSEKAGYANYTGGLAEKYQALLRSTFPLIDHVGIVAIKSTFQIKKLL
ncbi:MAG TPA: hypothetical protein VKC53_02915 [Patescibacteria group bacterium]|nr:hypothetical protein [Patescibacteria group bacterium]